MASLFQTLMISSRDMLNRLVDLDVTGNNLANINNAGYKASRANFQELLDNTSKHGSRLPATQLLVGQGTLRTTDNPLDWAIQGEGFFAVRLPNGATGYTRDGEFHLDANRRLVTASGYPLIWQGQIPAGMVDLQLHQDGTVEVLLENGQRANAGVVQLSRFANPTGLASNGDNVWLESPASGKAQTGAVGQGAFGKIDCYSLEQANVDLSQEMTHLMTLQRSFQMSTRVLQQTDSMISQAINLRKA